MLTFRNYRSKMASKEGYTMKENKGNNLNIRISESDQRELAIFISHWYVKGVDMSTSEVVRNALDEYIESYDYVKTILEGNLMGVRMDPNKYKFEDLFNMAADMQSQFEKEQDPSKKYLYGKMFELMSDAVNLEFNVSSFKKGYKVETPEDFSNKYYKVTKRLVNNFGNRK